jgi:hypothetical protein
MRIYRLGCTLGTLDVCYQAADLELTLADFHELEDIPDTTVSLTEVARSLALVNQEYVIVSRTVQREGVHVRE